MINPTAHRVSSGQSALQEYYLSIKYWRLEVRKVDRSSKIPFCRELEALWSRSEFRMSAVSQGCPQNEWQTGIQLHACGRFGDEETSEVLV